MTVKVYIASPYTKGNVEQNVMNQIKAAEELRELGFLPFVPLLSHFWNRLSPHPYMYWMDMDLEWVYVCDCILRLPGESEGADMECKEARRIGIPVFYDVSVLVNYGKDNLEQQ